MNHVNIHLQNSRVLLFKFLDLDFNLNFNHLPISGIEYCNNHFKYK